MAESIADGKKQKRREEEEHGREFVLAAGGDPIGLWPLIQTQFPLIAGGKRKWEKGRERERMRERKVIGVGCGGMREGGVEKKST